MHKSSTSLYCYKTCRCRPCCKCDRKNYGQKEQRVEFDYSRIDTSKTFFTPSNVNVIWLSRCSLNRYCVFFKNSRKFATLPRQHSAAIGCTKNYQPIGVTVHSHCVESFEGLLQRCRRGRGCSKL